jgi:hypothetical protein
VIVVVGHPALRAATPPAAGGRAAEVALEAARRGSRVELIGACGDDPAGDALLIALAGAGIGHAATLRDATHPTPVLADASAPDDDDADDETSLLAMDGDAGVAPPAPRPSGPTLDAADVALGLAYLVSFEVVVVTDDVSAAVLPVAIEAAGYAGAHLVLLVRDGGAIPPSLPAAATALAAPAGMDGGAFGALVGAYAAALDGGASPADAFAAATGAAGWAIAEPAGGAG